MKYLKCHWCGRETAIPGYDPKKMSTVLCSCSEEGIKQIYERSTNRKIP